MTLNSISETCRFKGSRGSDIGDARQLWTPNNPNPVSIGASFPCLHQICDLLKRAWWAQILAILWLSLSAKKHGYFYKSANGVGTLSLSLSRSLSLMRMEHISMTQNVWAACVIIDHKYECDHTKYLSLSCFTIMQVKKNPNIRPTRNTYSSIPTRSNNDLDYVTSRFASADVKPGRVTLQVTMGTPSSAVGRLSKNVRYVRC